jgi:hypothetical protein
MRIYHKLDYYNRDYVPIIQFRDVLAHAAAVSPSGSGL